MPKITAVRGRILYTSRGSRTIEVDVESEGGFMGRVCAPSGASVGAHEVAGFPSGGPTESIKIISDNADKFAGIDAGDLAAIHETVRSIDDTADYSKIGGAAAFAMTIAATESAARSAGVPLFKAMADGRQPRLPYPLGNVLGGGAHAGPGTPDIQEILVCATGAKTIREAIETNLAVHAQLGDILRKKDPSFTNGRGDEGGWAPRLADAEALEAAASACESLGYSLGKEVSLGVDFASSTQWDARSGSYVYERAGLERSPAEQIDFISELVKKYHLFYIEDAVHEEAFDEMAELVSRFPDTMITGDDLLVTNRELLLKAVQMGSCNAAILKVNQAGSLLDAFSFAREAEANKIKIVTSHRSGESIDSHIVHIGIATGSKLLKVGIVGGERVAKINELARLSEQDLIYGMAEL